MPLVRELGIALVFVILAAEVSVANPSVPRALRLENRPEWMVAAVMYPHIFQGWSLFSPEAPLSDETVVRRRRDPRRPPRRSLQRGRQPRRRRCRSTGVPVRLGHDSFWCDYTLRIPDAPQYHQALLEWILRYPERTGRPEDAIVRFEAFVIWQDSPKPGETAAADQHPQAALPALAGDGGAVSDAVTSDDDVGALGEVSRATSPTLPDRRRAQPRLRADRAGAVLLSICVRRIPDITLFYSNLGLVPNHMMLWRPPTQWMFSFFFILSHPDEVAFAFVLCGLVYFLLLVGWRTRLMQVLSLICVLSLHGRVTLMENGGDWMLGELALWTAFLPLGRRFSVDAAARPACARGARRRRPSSAIARRWTCRSSMTRRVAGGAGAGRCRSRTRTSSTPLHKGGPTWRSGTAVHYVLHQDRMVHLVRGLDAPVHDAVAVAHPVVGLAGHGVDAAGAAAGAVPEGVGAPGRHRLRSSALHLGFQCFINLGIFSFAMIGYTPFLLTGADWEALARFAQRRERRLAAYFDAGCGVCFQIVRVWARLDRLGRITFRSSADLAAPAPERVPTAVPGVAA